MDGRIDAVVVGSGTAGTFTGLARYIKETQFRMCSPSRSRLEGSVLGGGQPGPHKVEGIGNTFIPKEFRSLRLRRGIHGHRCRCVRDREAAWPLLKAF